MDPASVGAGAATGAAREATKLVATSVSKVVSSIREGKLAALGSRATVQQLVDKRGAPEAADWKPFLTTREQRDMVCAGLHLRAIATDQDVVRDVREAILQEYGPKHLRLAEAVQAELIDPILSSLKKYSRTPVEYANRAVGAFQDIDRHLLLVKDRDVVDVAAAQVRWRLQQEQPPVFVIAGSGGMVETATTIAHAAQDGTLDYDLTTTTERNRIYHLLRRVKAQARS